MRGRLLVGLAAGEERDAGHRRRHAGLEQADRLLGDFIDRRTFRALFAGHHHVGLQHHAFELHLLKIELLERGLQNALGDGIASVGVVIAVHQHFGLNDRDDAFLLAQRGIAPRARGVGQMQAWLGIFGPSRSPRHLANLAPRLRYSITGSRKPLETRR